MNRSVVFLWILLLFVIVSYSTLQREGYVTSALQPSAQELEEVNQQYATLLLFLQKYPDRSIPFIKDIQTKFFTDSCIVKPSISFDSLAQFPNGMLFV